MGDYDGTMRYVMQQRKSALLGNFEPSDDDRERPVRGEKRGQRAGGKDDE